MPKKYWHYTLTIKIRQKEENKTMDNHQFVAEISRLRPSSTFLAIKGYMNASGELADYSLVFNMSYKAALERSIITLKTMHLTSDLEKKAREELLESFQTSLAKPPVEEVADAYRHFEDEEGSPIKGVKEHMATGNLHLYGLVVAKRIYMPGHYKKVNHKPLTVAKNKLRALTPCGKFRQFILNSSQVESVSVDKMSLLPPE
jgi:hypothetical protein